MLDGYHQTGSGYENKKRIIAVNAALEIIKATLSTPTNAKNAEYELEMAVKHIAPLADAIQAAIDKK
ncbi:hypothetical protein ACB303_24440 [Citrobacter farmeri]|nr:hypothetical protein [Citrobacter farmeri]HAU5705251.1 hypothetical protein [Citrobacter freundii]HEJ0064946.1 hypothetical protein [Citrobacter koseri]HEM8489982.1 hypothetical protein [Citrobacter koseri]HEM8506183.1 hypothetical protein [Citrobacter koseri]